MLSFLLYKNEIYNFKIKSIEFKSCFYFNDIKLFIKKYHIVYK